MIFLFAVLVTILRATARPRMSLADTAVLLHRVWPHHAEARFAQQAYYAHYFELGRWDFGTRVGMVRLMMRNGWTVTVSGQAISYKRPLRRFQKFEIHTRFAGIDAGFLLFEQHIQSDGKLVAAASLRLACRDGRQGVNPAEVVHALGITHVAPADVALVAKWALISNSSVGSKE